MLVNRVSNLDLTWRQEMDELTVRAAPSLELTLDDLGVRRSVEQMTFLEMKRNFHTHFTRFTVFRLVLWQMELSFEMRFAPVPARK